MLLTSNHQRPPATYTHDGLRYGTQPLIDAGNYNELASKADCYRHESVGPGPYSGWVLSSDEHGPLYRRETRPLTAEEEAALLEKAEQEVISAAEKKADKIARIAAVDAVIDELPDSEVEELTYVYPAWSGDGIGVVLDQKVRHNGILYRVVQAHTTQPDWPPDATPALFTRYRDPSAEPEPWVQPTGAHDTYSTGERVTYAGQTWVSDVDNNSWEPGVFGWTVWAN